MNLYFNGPQSVFLLVSAIGNKAIEPSYSSKVGFTPRMLVTKFGDGYSQRAPDGINDRPLSLTLNFTNRSDKIITELVKFFRGEGNFYTRRPHEYFYLIPPLPYGDGVSYLKFITDGEISFTYEQFNSSTLNVNVMQVFDP